MSVMNATVLEKPKVSTTRAVLVTLFLFLPGVLFAAASVALVFTIVGIPFAVITAFTSYAFFLCGMLALGHKNMKAFARYAEQRKRTAIN